VAGDLIGDGDIALRCFPYFRLIMRGAARQCATPVYDHHIDIQERPHEIDA
jgi:hypothetical protein